jgi:hypothetical protein
MLGQELADAAHFGVRELPVLDHVREQQVRRAFE